MTNPYLDKIAIYFKDSESRRKHEQTKFQISANNHVIKHSAKIRAQIIAQNKEKPLKKKELKDHVSAQLASNGKFKKDWKHSYHEHTSKIKDIEAKYGMKPSDFMDPETMADAIMGKRRGR